MQKGRCTCPFQDQACVLERRAQGVTPVSTCSTSALLTCRLSTVNCWFWGFMGPFWPRKGVGWLLFSCFSCFPWIQRGRWKSKAVRCRRPLKSNLILPFWSSTPPTAMTGGWSYWLLHKWAIPGTAHPHSPQNGQWGGHGDAPWARDITETICNDGGSHDNGGRLQSYNVFSCTTNSASNLLLRGDANTKKSKMMASRTLGVHMRSSSPIMKFPDRVDAISA